MTLTEPNENTEMQPPVPERATVSGHERLASTRRAIEALEHETRIANTERAYVSGLKYFWAWAWLTVGSSNASYPVPPDLVERFVADSLQGLDPGVDRDLVELGIKRKTGPLKLSTVRQRLWALGRAHVEHLGEAFSDHVHTRAVRELFKRASKQARNKTKHPDAIDSSALLRILAALEKDPTPRHVLIAAVMATAFAAGGLRRSEICALSMDDVRRFPADEALGYRLTLATRERKTRDAGDDPVIRPVRGGAAVYLYRWLGLREAEGVTGDPLFRAVRPDGGIAKGISEAWLYGVVKEAATLGGLDPARISPHSLRFGYVTSAHRSGMTTREAMAMSRHRSPVVYLRHLDEQDSSEGAAGHLLRFGRIVIDR